LVVAACDHQCGEAVDGSHVASNRLTDSQFT